MRDRVRRCYACLSEPIFMRRFHGFAAIFWVCMAPPSMLTGLRNSVSYLVGLSVYAVIAGHWSSWQAARIEVKEDERNCEG